jgi:hypothetical protein
MGNRQIVAVISDNRRHHLFDLVEEVDLTELQGPPGPSGGNACSPTTTGFTVPMPGETVEVTIQDARWIVGDLRVDVGFWSSTLSTLMT